jgi:hypothetical protein
MNRVVLTLSFLMLVVVAVGVVVATNSQSLVAHPFSFAQSSAGIFDQNQTMMGEGSGAAVEPRAETQGDDDEAQNFPPALRRHISKLMEAVPNEGPAGSAEDWRFLARAYPDTDISLAKTEGARAAHAEHVANFQALLSTRATAGAAGVAAAAAAPAAWVRLGPTQALYPLSQFRNYSNYVPNAYEAGGRTTSLAISPVCVPGNCRLYATPAGGGVWRTNDALATIPKWTYLSASFGINSGSSIAIDPNDSNTIWAGTGEANASADSEAGVGLYKSTDGGDTWTGPIGKAQFNARSIGTIAIDPTNSNTIYVGTVRGVRGISSVLSGGAVTLAPGAPPWGLYKSSDGGATWKFIFNGAQSTAGCTNTKNVASNLTLCSVRGVRRVALDPVNPNIVYASAFAKGVWRSNDGGNTWNQIFLPIADGPSTSFTERAEIAVTRLPGGNTRMYLVIGQIGAPPAQTYRSNAVQSGTPSFLLLTSSNINNKGYATFNSCEGQCWYDNFVYTPKGHPDTVYVGGSYAYGESGAALSNNRGVVLSTDGGVTFTDMTFDASDALHPNGLHPDQHTLVTNPNNPLQFFEGNDGGIMRSSGLLTDASAVCAPRGATGATLTRCEQLLSAIPTEIHGINRGLSTLQFQSLSVSPFDATLLQGGTQDNGTWQSTNSANLFVNTIFGDGGQSGFDVANPKFRFHTYYAPQVDVNFTNGYTGDWNWIADTIVNTGGQFYIPIISDPKVSGTMFAGTNTVYRTKTHGMGTMNINQLRFQCNEFTGHFQVTCGDWVPIGATNLTDPSLGTLAGGSMAAVGRTASDSSTLWVATTTGRIFISTNADAEPNTAVTFTRIDTTSTAAPNRFISGIAIDPANSNHAWISYSGYSATTPATPGHLFEVTYNPTTQTATFVNRSANLRDLPVTDVAYDPNTGDLYTSSDFGVYRLKHGNAQWYIAGTGLPNVEVAGLTLVPGARVLYAATHGLGAWAIQLP